MQEIFLDLKKKEKEDTTVKDIRNGFRLKKEKEAIKSRITDI